MQVSENRGDRREYQSHFNTNASHKQICLHYNLICFLPWRKGLGSRFWIASLVVIIRFVPGIGTTHIYWLQQDQSQSSAWFNKQDWKGERHQKLHLLNHKLSIVSEKAEAPTPLPDHSSPWYLLPYCISLFSPCDPRQKTLCSTATSMTLLLKKVPAKTWHSQANELNGLLIFPYFF